jgi:hypothetical protein
LTCRTTTTRWTCGRWAAWWRVREGSLCVNRAMRKAQKCIDCQPSPHAQVLPRATPVFPPVRLIPRSPPQAWCSGASRSSTGTTTTTSW